MNAPEPRAGRLAIDSLTQIYHALMAFSLPQANGLARLPSYFFDTVDEDQEGRICFRGFPFAFKAIRLFNRQRESDDGVVVGEVSGEIWAPLWQREHDSWRERGHIERIACDLGCPAN